VVEAAIGGADGSAAGTLTAGESFACREFRENFFFGVCSRAAGVGWEIAVCAEFIMLGEVCWG
jgi:hypothetical protein